MRAYKAKWIITAEGEPLENHYLIVEDGKVIDVLPHEKVNFDDLVKVKDFGNAVITPGFVNLFTQLQYTDINKYRSKTIKSFIKRIFKNIIRKYIFAGIPQSSYVRGLARMYKEYFCWERTEKIRSFKHGLEKAMLSGTTCIAQVSKENKYFQILNNAPIKTYLFFELYADSRDAGKSEFRKISSKIEYFIKNKSDNMFIGVAPCSLSMVHKRLWKIISKYARKNNLLMLIRIAESQEEMDWLKHGFSDIDMLHMYLGMRKLNPYRQNISPVQYLKDLNVLSKKVLVANANYLSKDEFKELADTSVKFVYSPRYDDLNHGRKQEFKDVVDLFGENFGFGTESYFNIEEDHSLINEANYANKDNILNCIDLIKHLTIYPAKILKLDSIVGSLSKGKHADFNVFNLNENESYCNILSKANPDMVYVNGHRIVQNQQLRKAIN
ncbi:amidohydrolase family protein [bacterium]|nr:amidohydrolase family protein [bacterium]